MLFDTRGNVVLVYLFSYISQLEQFTAVLILGTTWDQFLEFKINLSNTHS